MKLQALFSSSFWVWLFCVAALASYPTTSALAAESIQEAGPGGLVTDSPIKVIQRKDFMKVGRLEGSLFLGTEAIDAFTRNLVGGMSGTYHLTEVFAVEGLVGYSPSLTALGETLGWENADALDLRELSLEIQESAGVVTITSKIGLYGNVGLVYSPFYGKYAWLSRDIVNFDLYFMFGPGFIMTQDRNTTADEEESTSGIVATTNQTHVASQFGFGFRAALGPQMALKIEGREYIHFESLMSDGSESIAAKYYFMTQASVSFFFK